MISEAETIVQNLQASCVATITTVLRERGLHKMWVGGCRPLGASTPRVAGRAFTVRFTPAREDLLTPEAIGGTRSARGAIERMPEGAIVVVDAGGFDGAGAFGDIMCARMQYRGVSALVCDGAVRDKQGILKLDWPVWTTGIAGPPSPAGYCYADEQVAVACGGVTIMPGDYIVADEDGAVVVPAAIAVDVALAACKKEAFEEWALDQVRAGEPILGLYPPNEATQVRYAALSS